MYQIGDHSVTNGSIDDPQVDQLFSDGRKAHILYCDPPWGDGAMKMFATMAEKVGEHPKRISYDTLINRLFSLIQRFVSGHVFIEIGPKWAGDIESRMRTAGLGGVEVTEIVYGGDKLVNVLLFGSYQGGRANIERVKGLSGGKVSREAIATLAKRGEILFDPTCGLGYSARAAVAHGMVFRGNELSMNRLRRTMEVLKRGVK